MLFKICHKFFDTPLTKGRVLLFPFQIQPDLVTHNTQNVNEMMFHDTEALL